MNCTIFKNIWDKDPYIITVDKALERVKTGRSAERISEIRDHLSKDRADRLKAHLPSVCFSGVFTERKDECLKTHSGFLVLDFDNLQDLRNRQSDIISHDFVYACWLSPRGNGLKALVKIADGTKHREHFVALQELFPDADKSGVNESRVCYESYDPDIYINPEAKPFKKIKKVERIQEKETLAETSKIFENIMRWLTNRGDAFVTGERNLFVFKLASACCRFGMTEEDCMVMISNQVLDGSNSFTKGESERAVKSAYRTNKQKFGTARFEKDVLVDHVTRKEIKVDETFFDETIKPKDVIYGEDVKAKALDIYLHGYEKLHGIGVPQWDEYFKYKRGEITLLSGIGNYGKTACWHWFHLMRCIVHDDRFAFFSPENNPPEDFYHDWVECLLGCELTPFNPGRPSQVVYEAAYDWVSKRIFYVFPKEMAPTPEYIKERFLELIIKEKVTGVVIDPFNQLANDYGTRTDKYLETFLSDSSRFAQINNVFFSIIAHPKTLTKGADGNYPHPDVYDIADGGMWNNKMDNILIYHRPNHQKDPQSPLCEVYTKKIRRQKIVGKKGIMEFEYYRPQRRYYFDGSDPMAKVILEKGLDFVPKMGDLFPGNWKPVSTNWND